MEEPVPDVPEHLQQQVNELAQKNEQLLLEVAENKEQQKRLLNIHEKHVENQALKKRIEYGVLLFSGVSLLIAIFSGVLFYRQNAMFEKQNKLVEEQNKFVQVQTQLAEVQTEKAEQQSYLAESARRAALVAELTEIMNKIDEELDEHDRKGKKGKHTLSPRLIGRIVGLSRSLKPYKYLNNEGCLIDDLLSPERGQLLINLVNADIDTTSLIKIYKDADFSYADLQNITLDETHFLKGARLSSANLKEVRLYEVNFQKVILANANLQSATLMGVSFQEADLSNANLKWSNLEGSIFQEVNLSNANFEGAFVWYGYFFKSKLLSANLQGIDLKNANLQEADLENANLNDSYLEYANLQGTNLNKINLQDTKVESKTWFKDLQKLPKPPKGLKALMEKYKVDTNKIDKDGGYYKIIEK